MKHRDLVCLLVCDPARPRAVPAAPVAGPRRWALPQPTPEPIKLKAAANSLQCVLETGRCLHAGAHPGLFQGQCQLVHALSCLASQGVSKPGTLMHLMVTHSPSEEFPAGRGCPRFPHASPTLPKAGQGLAGAGGKQAKGEQRDVPAAAVRNEVTSEHIDGVA